MIIFRFILISESGFLSCSYYVIVYLGDKIALNILKREIYDIH